MALNTFTVQIQSRSGRELASLEADGHTTVSDLKKKFAKVKKQYYPARQRLTLPAKPGEQRGEVLSDDEPLIRYNPTSGQLTIQFKDLGPQIGWTTVFFLEYLGPLLVYPLFYFFPTILYPGDKAAGGAHAQVQTLALGYWSFHYFKRILETLFVHRFGHSTMPIFNLFKNCTYYWGFAAFVSYFVNHPKYTAPPQMQSLVCLSLAVLCQLANAHCHLILKNLRQAGEKEYKIPRGFLFNQVTCANYTTEIWGWVLFAVATQTVAAAVFIVAGTYQMIPWAIQKHKRLLKTFDGKDGRQKYPKRWIILPPFL